MFKTLTFLIKIEDSENYLKFMEQCSDVFNDHILWSIENQSYNKNQSHKDLYFTIREKHPELPSGIIQSVRDVAMESMKATKLKRKPTKKKYSAIRYDKRNMTLRGQQLTFSSIGGRIKTTLHVPEYYKDIFEGWDFKNGTICYNSKIKQFYAKLVFKTETPDLIKNNNVIGIDRGIYNIVTLSTGEIINSKEIRKQQRKYLYNRKKLQAKGTPSSKKKLKQLSGKEKRFSKDFNHCISKYVANLDCGTFAIEDLKNIRKQKIHNKKFNKWLSSWSFYQFEQFLSYKAEALGKRIVYIDPRYTSQKCSCCGSIKKENRNKSKFKCIECGYHNHSDINAAFNIRQNYLLSVTVMSSEQAAVNQPNVPVTISEAILV